MRIPRAALKAYQGYLDVVGKTMGRKEPIFPYRGFLNPISNKMDLHKMVLHIQFIVNDPFNTGFNSLKTMPDDDQIHGLLYLENTIIFLLKRKISLWTLMRRIEESRI